MLAEQSRVIKRCIREVRDCKELTLDTKDGEKFTFDFIAGEEISQEAMFR